MGRRSGYGRHVIAFAAWIFVATSEAIPASDRAEAVSFGSAEERDTPPTEPILRLNTTAHTAPIWRIATDRENRYAVTASSDKTARVWSLPDGRLAAVLRVPIDNENMGKLFAVAMTPDGSTVALSGWTGGSGTQENIYLFDRVSGALQRRISGLPNVINHLAYSADGRLLIAALGSNGIRVYDASQGYKLLPSDTAYSDRSNWADFDRQGRLVTTSDDGFIRLYAARNYNSPIAKVKARGINDPYSAVFSPDSERIAVGDYNSTAIDLLSGKDLGLTRTVDTSGVVSKYTSGIGWSADARYLFAAFWGGVDRGPPLGEWREWPACRYRGRQ